MPSRESGTGQTGESGEGPVCPPFSPTEQGAGSIRFEVCSPIDPDEWQAIANEQQPYIYTTAAMGMGALRNKFENIYPSVLAMANRQASTWNIWEIFVKEGQPLQ